jgi:hypothetical protein
MNAQPCWRRYAWHALTPVILAIAYGSFDGSSGPARSAVARVDARTGEVQQLADLGLPGGAEHRGRDQHVVVQEIGRPVEIRLNAADRAGGVDHVLRPAVGKPCLDRLQVAKINLAAGSNQDIIESCLLQPPHDGRADQSAVPGNVDARVTVHGLGPGTGQVCTVLPRPTFSYSFSIQR